MLKPLPLGSRTRKASRSIRALQWAAHEDAFDGLVLTITVGQVLGGQVVFMQGKRCIVRLGCGLLATLEHYLDDLSPKRFTVMPRPVVGAVIDVYVRSIRHHGRQIVVSTHPFEKLDRFNLFNSGYRSGFNGSESRIGLLPWERKISFP